MSWNMSFSPPVVHAASTGLCDVFVLTTVRGYPFAGPEHSSALALHLCDLGNGLPGTYVHTVHRHHVQHQERDGIHGRRGLRRRLAVRRVGGLCSVAETLSDGSKAAFTSIEDRWNRDPAYQERMRDNGVSLERVQLWDQLGPHIGEDPKLYDRPFYQRQSMFTRKTVFATSSQEIRHHDKINLMSPAELAVAR